MQINLVDKLLALAASLLIAIPAVAQEKLDFELTPFAAYRIGGDFEDDETGDEFDLDDSEAFGLILNIRAKTQGQWEILYAKQSTEVDTAGTFVASESIDLDVHYFQLGGTYLYDGDRVVPFIALTLGVTHFDPEFADLDSENYFSASFGGGIKMDLSQRVGVRLEGRVYSTFLESNSRIFCSSGAGGGQCLIESSGTTLNQWEARAGLVFRF